MCVAGIKAHGSEELLVHVVGLQNDAGMLARSLVVSDGDDALVRVRFCGSRSKAIWRRGMVEDLRFLGI